MNLIANVTQIIHYIIDEHFVLENFFFELVFKM